MIKTDFMVKRSQMKSKFSVSRMSSIRAEKFSADFDGFCVIPEMSVNMWRNLRHCWGGGI